MNAGRIKERECECGLRIRGVGYWMHVRVCRERKDRRSKFCRGCQLELPVTEFYTRRSRADGLYYRCKQCARMDVNVRRNTPRGADIRKLYYRKNRKRILARLGQRRKMNIEANRRYAREYYRKHGERVRAAYNARYAIRRGILKRPKLCSSCGRRRKVQGHHDDYAKQLEVRWLCASCHKVADNERRRRDSALGRITQ